MCVNDECKKFFGKFFCEYGVIFEWIVKFCFEIDVVCFIVFNVVIKMDEYGFKKVLKEIVEVKVFIFQIVFMVIDCVVQVYGGVGVCQDILLVVMWVGIWILRFVDGLDEVYLQQMGRNENKCGKVVVDLIKWQQDKMVILMKQYGLSNVELGIRIQRLKIQDRWWRQIGLLG